MKISNGRLHRPRLASLRTAAVLAVAFIFILVGVADAATKLSISGFLDFGYTVNDPTDGRPEHKLWYNDGYWWASMYDNSSGDYTIHRLNWHTQTWEDTGVFVDDREQSRSDALWDGNKLYIATYLHAANPSAVVNLENKARLMRYSYNATTDQYSLDSGFPVLGINNDKTDTLSLDKDSNGKLWITYVSRPDDTSNAYQVYVNSSDTSDQAWNTPYSLTSAFATEALVDSDGIAGLIAFSDNGGAKVGVMWSNELPTANRFYFAVHPDASAYNTGWVMDADAVDFPYSANNHINLAKTSSGEVFAALKTSETVDGEPLNVLVARDLDGIFYNHNVNPVESNDTRPIVAVYEPTSGDDKVYVFMTSESPGGVICTVEATITTPLSAMVFQQKRCGATGVAGARIIIGDDSQYDQIDSATTTRQILNEDSDIVVLASDQANSVYVHGVVLTEFPAVIARDPGPGDMVDITNVTIDVTFDLPMNASTVINGFEVIQDGSIPVTGQVTYNSVTRTATFTPDDELIPGADYSVTLADTILSQEGVTLLDSPMTWEFSISPEATEEFSIYLPIITK